MWRHTHSTWQCGTTLQGRGAMRSIPPACSVIVWNVHVVRPVVLEDLTMRLKQLNRCRSIWGDDVWQQVPDAIVAIVWTPLTHGTCWSYWQKDIAFAGLLTSQDKFYKEHHKRKNKGAKENKKVLLQGFPVLLQELRVMSLEMVTGGELCQDWDHKWRRLRATSAMCLVCIFCISF